MAGQGEIPDWITIKTEYLTTSISYRKLAEKYCVSFNTLQHRARKEGWAKEREKTQKRITTKTIEKATRKRAAKLASLMTAADNMTDVINRYSEDTKNFETDGAMNSQAVKNIVVAIKELTTVIRDLYDLPSYSEREAQRIAGERLELERRRVEADDETDRMITVVMTDMDEYSY